MRKRGLISYVVLFFLAMSILNSCKKEAQNETNNTDKVVIGDMTFPNDAGTATSRVVNLNESIEFTVPFETNNEGLSENIALDYKLIAELPSPNDKLSASYVLIDGEYAYIAYHIQGNEFGGGLEIISLKSDIATIESRMFYALNDINAIAIDNQTTTVNGKTIKKLWLAGSSFKKGALLTEIYLENGLFNPNSSSFKYKEIALPGANANGVAISDKELYVTTGATRGGAFAFNKASMELVESLEFQNAKFVDVENTAQGSNLVWFQASPEAFLHHGIVEGNRFQNNFSIGSYFYPGDDQAIPDYRGKSTIRVKDGLCYVSMGEMGLKVFDLQSQSSQPVYTLPKPSNGYTNGINFLNDDMLMVANGSAGLYITTLPQNDMQDSEMQILGIYQYNKSTNYAAGNENYIVIANGKDGVKILKKQNPIIGNDCPPDANGVPSCVTLEDVCGDIMSQINLTLKERINAMISHPELFTYPRLQYISLNKKAELTISFLQEGASFTNSLAYFVFDPNNLPANPNNLNVKVVFPNASAQNSGGGLLAGHTVSLGEFPAGTHIGFMMYSNGWRNGQQTQGHYQVYSIDDYNVCGLPQSLMIWNQDCEMLGVGFEDIPVNQRNCDRDFNDVVIGVKAYPTDAITLNPSR